MSDFSPFDILVVGAGPAGIAAAVTAAQAGKRVGLVDDNPNAGGQIWRHKARKVLQTREARRWFSRLAAARLTHLAGTSIVAAPATGTLLAENSTGPLMLHYKALILATGARELFLPFPGWTIPGVFGAGALQALVKSGLDVRGKRILVAGTGPLLLAVAALLRASGAMVPLIAEQTSAAHLRAFALGLPPGKLLGAIAFRAKLLGTRYAVDSYPLRVQPDGSGLRVTFRIGLRTEEWTCDYFACGFGLIPNIELPVALGCKLMADGFVETTATQQTSQPNIYAVGEITGIGGLDKSIIEGRIAGLAATGKNPAILALAHKKCQTFAQRLARAFALRPELLTLADGQTILCRCEDVPLSAVQGHLNTRDAKLQTRCGMGPCQGRICGPALRLLLHSQDNQIRPPILPASIATLAAAVGQKE